MEFTGILMAGGQSTRMKQDKGLMLYNGKMMASFGLEVLKATCESCLISTNNPQYQCFKTPLIEDMHKHIGPMGGLHAALVNSPTRHIVVLGCDLPNIKTEVIEFLKHKLENADAVIPVHGNNQTEPLVAIYSKSILPMLEDMIKNNNYKMHQLLSNANTAFVNVDHLISLNPKLFLNMNSIHDLSI